MEWSRDEADGGAGSAYQGPLEEPLIHQFVPFPTAPQCRDSAEEATESKGFHDFCGPTIRGARDSVDAPRGELLEAEPAGSLRNCEGIPWVGQKRKRSRGTGTTRELKRRKFVKIPAGAHCHVRLLRKGKKASGTPLVAQGVEPLPPSKMRRRPHRDTDLRHGAGTRFCTKPPGQSRKGPPSSAWQPPVFLQFTTPQPSLDSAFSPQPVRSTTDRPQGGRRPKGNQSHDGAAVGTTTSSGQAKRRSRQGNRAPRASSWQRRKQAAAALHTTGTTRTTAAVPCTANECTDRPVSHTPAGLRLSNAVGGQNGAVRPQGSTLQYHPRPGGPLQEGRAAADVAESLRPNSNKELQRPGCGGTAHRGVPVTETDTHVAGLDPGPSQSSTVPRDPKARQARKASPKDGACSRDPVLLPRQCIFYLGAFAPSPGLPATRGRPFFLLTSPPIAFFLPPSLMGSARLACVHGGVCVCASVCGGVRWRVECVWVCGSGLVLYQRYGVTPLLGCRLILEFCCG